MIWFLVATSTSLIIAEAKTTPAIPQMRKAGSISWWDNAVPRRHALGQCVSSVKSEVSCLFGKFPLFNLF